MSIQKSYKKHSSILFIESSANIFFALLLNFALLYFLEAHGYGAYAVGIAASAIACLTSIGVQTLVPEYIASKSGAEGKIWKGVKLQILLILIYLGFIISLSPYLINSAFSEIAISKNILIASAVYYFSQVLDETVHIYLRLSLKELLSLKLTIASKIVILIVCIIIAIKYPDGELTFITAAILLFVISMLKFLALVYPHRNTMAIEPDTAKINISIYSSLWLGNVSNALFNGVMRLTIGEIYGAKMVGMLTMSSQIGAAFSNLTSALTMGKVMYAWRSSSSKYELRRNTRGSIVLSSLSSIICIIVSAIILYLSFGGGSHVIFQFTGLDAAILPISIAFSANILTIPLYQACQFFAKAKLIAIANFCISILGICSMYLIIYLFQLSSMTIEIFLAVSLASAISIIIIYLNISPSTKNL